MGENADTNAKAEFDKLKSDMERELRKSIERQAAQDRSPIGAAAFGSTGTAAQREALTVTTPQAVADLFVHTCERLCSMGATRVEGFGMVACFGAKPAPERDKAEPPPTMPQGLTPDEQDVWRRSRVLLGGGR